MKKGFRFQRLEYQPILSVFKRARRNVRRFERLEVEGHKIKIEIAEEKVKTFTICPKCQRKNPQDALYCLYCDYVFEKIAQQEEAVELKPFQIRCPGCAKVCVRTQKNCFYCGWRIAPWEKDETISTQEERKRKDPLKQGEVVTLTIDGKTYRSTDEVIPLDIRELMLKIKQEGYSKEMIDAWVKKKNLEADFRRESLSQKIDAIRWEILWRVLGIIGLILFIIIYVWLRLSLGR